MYAIAQGLPMAHVTQTRMCCQATGDPISDSNQPFCLPSGYVIGEEAIARLTQNEKVRCPVTEQWYPREELQKIYFT